MLWFVFSLIRSIEKDIIEVKAKGIVSSSNSPIILNTLFLESTEGNLFSANQLAQLKNIVFKLQQRKDLVLFVAGYSDNSLDRDQFQKVSESKKAAENVRNFIISQGVEQVRIFFDGFGQDVPNNFLPRYKTNVALILVNIYELMEGSNVANSIRAV